MDSASSRRDSAQNSGDSPNHDKYLTVLAFPPLPSFTVHPHTPERAVRPSPASSERLIEYAPSTPRRRGERSRARAHSAFLTLLGSIHVIGKFWDNVSVGYKQLIAYSDTTQNSKRCHFNQ